MSVRCDLTVNLMYILHDYVHFQVLSNSYMYICYKWYFSLSQAFKFLGAVQSMLWCKIWERGLLPSTTVYLFSMHFFAPLELNWLNFTIIENPFNLVTYSNYSIVINYTTRVSLWHSSLFQAPQAGREPPPPPLALILLPTWGACNRLMMFLNDEPRI